MDLRILLLIRDPRGIYNSRKSLMHHLTPEQRTDNIKWTCGHHIENYKFLNKLPTGLRKKIMTVRYEVSF